jgi:choline dehydrogenase-like flavoprotein
MVMGFLGKKAKKILANIADTFLPRLSEEKETFFHLSASDFNLADVIEKKLEEKISAQEKKQFKYMLLMVNTPLFCGFTGGIWKSFLSLKAEKREKMLQAWELSSNKFIRQIFATFKETILFFFYSMSPEGKPNPSWSFVNFDTYVIPNLNIPKTISPLTITASTHLNCDALVIGSGAGGGIVAAELAKAGLDVIVVEKGEYLNETDFNSSNLLELYKRTLENGSFFLSADRNLILGVGNVLGGGTVVNYTGSARTPSYVLQEWADNYYFTDAMTPLYQHYLDVVSNRLHVNSFESQTDNKSCALLEQGCKNLKYSVDIYPRNVKGCVDCSFCYLGCRYGAKQDACKTYLQDASGSGARFLVKSFCQKILHKQGIARGALIISEDNQGRKHEVHVKAKLIVSAAGALHTPPLLLRSGLINPNIGANLKVHPGTSICSFFDEPVNNWHGKPMTRVSKEFINSDGSGYGSLITTVPIEPGFFSVLLPWLSARTHREEMFKFPYFSGFAVLARDYYGGHVKMNKQGGPACYYKLHPYDEKHLRQGMAGAIRIAMSVGAKEIFAHHAPFLRFRPHQDNLEEFLKKIEKISLNGNHSIGSAHLMSSCRLAGNPSLGAIKPNGETYEIKNLFVADGSALPTAAGVNPMLSIFALAYYIAQQIKNKVNIKEV